MILSSFLPIVVSRRSSAQVCEGETRRARMGRVAILDFTSRPHTNTTAAAPLSIHTGVWPFTTAPQHSGHQGLSPTG